MLLRHYSLLSVCVFTPSQRAVQDWWATYTKLLPPYAASLEGAAASAPASEAGSTQDSDSTVFVTSRLLVFSVSCWDSWPLTFDLGFHTDVPPNPLKKKTDQNAGGKSSQDQIPKGGGTEGFSSSLLLPWTPG